MHLLREDLLIPLSSTAKLTAGMKNGKYHLYSWNAGGKFGGGGYKVSGGLHGVGASVVNALSEWLEVSICRDGKRYEQRYERGKTMYPLREVGECGDSTGTTVTFLPDKQIFEETVYDYDILKQRLREMAFLTKGLKIILTDKREGMEREKTFHYEGGIREFELI